MAEQQIRFDDGAAYERMMGTWSRLAGDIFLDWLAPRPGLRWIVSVARPPDKRFGSCLTKERPEAVSRISCQRSPFELL